MCENTHEQRSSWLSLYPLPLHMTEIPSPKHTKCYSCHSLWHLSPAFIGKISFLLTWPPFIISMPAIRDDTLIRNDLKIWLNIFMNPFIKYLLNLIYWNLKHTEKWNRVYWSFCLGKFCFGVVTILSSNETFLGPWTLAIVICRLVYPLLGGALLGDAVTQRSTGGAGRARDWDLILTGLTGSVLSWEDHWALRCMGRLLWDPFIVLSP